MPAQARSHHPGQVCNDGQRHWQVAEQGVLTAAAVTLPVPVRLSGKTSMMTQQLAVLGMAMELVMFLGLK